MNVQCLYVFIDLALLEWIKVKAWLVKAIFVLIFLTVPALRTISVWALQFGMCFEWSKHMCIDQSNLDITVWDGNGMRFQNIGLINLFLWYCCLIFSLLDAQTAFFIIWELRGTLSNTLNDQNWSKLVTALWCVKVPNDQPKYRARGLVLCYAILSEYASCMLQWSPEGLVQINSLSVWRLVLN